MRSRSTPPSPRAAPAARGGGPAAGDVGGRSRRSQLQASLHGLAFEVGGYVVLGGTAAAWAARPGHRCWSRLGSRAPRWPARTARREPARTADAPRSAGGMACLLAGDGRPFHDRSRGRPSRRRSGRGSTRRGRRARLARSASSRSRPGSRAARRGGFDRHTFLCGQSGSGKTYSLGMVLERLLLETSLRLVILDPNSDFVRLGELARGCRRGRRRALRRGRRRRRRRAAPSAGASRCACGTLTPTHRAAVLASTRSPTARSTRQLARAARRAAAESVRRCRQPRARPAARRAGANLGSTAGGCGRRGDAWIAVRDALDAARALPVVDLGRWRPVGTDGRRRGRPRRRCGAGARPASRC